MKTGAEIAKILKAMRPEEGRPLKFLACPLNLAGARAGNPSADLASMILDLPLSICRAIVDRFDGDGRWPDSNAKIDELYRKRFKMSVLAGEKAGKEHDEPGTTW